MGATSLIIFAIAMIATATAANLPRIIWAIRCPADSPNYKCPAAGPLRRRSRGLPF